MPPIYITVTRYQLHNHKDIIISMKIKTDCIVLEDTLFICHNSLTQLHWNAH